MSTNDRTSERTEGQPAADRAGTQAYEIRLGGRLGTRWAAWFDGMTLSDQDDGTSVLRGSVVDQAALHGLLQTLRDLGIPLLSLTPLTGSTPTERPVVPAPPTRHHPAGETS